jgi:hypothetical protein
MQENGIGPASGDRYRQSSKGETGAGSERWEAIAVRAILEGDVHYFSAGDGCLRRR